MLVWQNFDVVIDLRESSSSFGQSVSVILDSEIKNQLWIPKGFAHGFCVLSESADFFYKCTDFYDPDDEAGLIWDDPDLAIDWPIRSPKLSVKDSQLPRFKDCF
jgi:dTDP-4-dehydrorhamnose 3,5-epimerase